MTESTFLKDMSAMKEQSDKYIVLRKRTDELTEKLNNISKMLSDIISELSPSVKTISGRQRMKGSDEVLEYALKYMRTGKYLSLNELEKAFPDRTEGSLGQIFYITIAKLKGVSSTKANGNKEYFLEEK